MDRLNRDITNIEQSIKLVKLGVPIKSSNFYFPLIPTQNGGWILSTEYPIKREVNEELHPGAIPVWSVGRLIEILEITVGAPWSDKQLLGKQGTLLERVISDVEDCIKFNKIDFSKLKEV